MRLCVVVCVYSLVMAVVAVSEARWFWVAVWSTVTVLGFKTARWLARESLLRENEYD